MSQNNHHSPTTLSIPDDHPILGLDAMLPLVWDHPKSIFDETNLLNLLRFSCTLTLQEKLKILKRLAFMNQEQVDLLTSKLVQEHEKFEFISAEFPDDVAELVETRMREIETATVRRGLSNN